MTNTNGEQKETKELIKGGLVPMDKLLKDAASSLKIYKESDSVEAKVERVMKSKIYVTIDDRINGIIGGKELLFDPHVAKGLKKGDVLTAYVVIPEDDDGNMLLSLRRAGKENIWANVAKKFEDRETISVVVSEANKGGLMIEYAGVRGFLPVSQLSAEHYPRVEGGNKDEILTKLNQMVGKPVDVKILSFDKAANKLIFSEREAIGNRDIPKTIKVGDIVDGKVTGIVDFGFFVDVNGIEGLVHISEISWAKVDNVENFVKVGDLLKLKIIDIENSRLSLSLKRLEEDPWRKMVKDIKVGDIVEGKINKITPFGAFIKLSLEGGEIDALVHISEISSKHVNDPKEVLKVGEKKNFKILTIEPEHHRLSLSLKALEEVSDKEDKKEKKEATASGEKIKKLKKEDEEIKEITEEIGETKVEKEKPLKEKKVKVEKAEKKEEKKPAKKAKSKK